MTNDIVKKMLEIEKRAKDIVSEADDRKSHIDEEISAEVHKMNESYTERANLRVKKVMKFEEEQAEETLKNLHQTTDETMSNIRKTYENNKEKWLEELYKKVIG